MTIDDVVAQIEGDLNTVSVAAVKLAIAAYIPASVAFFLTPVGNGVWNLLIAPFLTWLFHFPIKAADNGGYYLYKAATNNAAAQKYEDSIAAKTAAANLGDANAIAAARAAQLAAFKQLFPLTA